MEKAQPESSAPVTAPSTKALLTLAWPIVVGFSDAVMVSPLGEDALAAVTTGAINTFNVMILPMGIVFLVSSFSSQKIGAQDPSGARRYGIYGLIVAAVAGGLGVASTQGVAPALGWLDYSDGVRSAMTAYLQIRLLSMAAAVGLEALGNYYVGLGNSRLPMLAQLFAMGLNVVFNYLLIQGRFGFPALGVEGAAWASVIASTCGFLVLLLVFARGYGETGRPKAGRLQRQELWRVVRFGLPEGLNWFLEFLAFSFFINVVVVGAGTTTLAALMTTVQINSLSFMPAFGLAHAGAVFVGQQIGSKALDAVPPTVRLTLRVTVVWQLSVGLTYFFLADLWLSPFAEDMMTQGEFIEVAGRMLVWSVTWQVFDSGMTVYGESLRAAGDTLYPLLARLLIAWLLFVPGSFWAMDHLGDDVLAVVVSFVGYMGALTVVLWFRFQSNRWRQIDLLGATKSE